MTKKKKKRFCRKLCFLVLILTSATVVVDINHHSGTVVFTNTYFLKILARISSQAFICGFFQYLHVNLTANQNLFETVPYLVFDQLFHDSTRLAILLNISLGDCQSLYGSTCTTCENYYKVQSSGLNSRSLQVPPQSLPSSPQLHPKSHASKR